MQSSVIILKDKDIVISQLLLYSNDATIVDPCTSVYIFISYICMWCKYIIHRTQYTCKYNMLYNYILQTIESKRCDFS